MGQSSSADVPPALQIRIWHASNDDLALVLEKRLYYFLPCPLPVTFSAPFIPYIPRASVAPLPLLKIDKHDAC